MKKNLFRFLSLAGLLLLPIVGCIESDETRSFYISPEGQVDVIIYQDNVHATDAEDGPKDLEKWFREIKSREGGDVSKLKETGAKDIKVTVLREVVPYAAVIRAHYDSVEAFGRLFDLNREGKDGTLTLEKQGSSRRLIFQAKDTGKQAPIKKGNADDPANYAPLWKFIPVGGRIDKADGFILSKDKKSCILNLPKLDRMKKMPEGYRFAIEWTTD